MADIQQLLAKLPQGGGAGSPPGAAPSATPGTPDPLKPAGAGLGAATKPQANQGNAAAALIDVRNAVQMLEKALPNIPMGTPLHSDILQVTVKLSKHLKPEEASSGLQIQSLLQQARQTSKSAPMQAMARLYPGQDQSSGPAMPAGDGGAMPQAA